MDEILELYRNLRKTQVVDFSVRNYNNINVALDGQNVHVYDATGKMPFGKYPIPNTEQAFTALIEKLDNKVKELTENYQFLCGKCGGTFDLPESKRDKNGYPICAKCVSGGDLRVDHPKRKEGEAPPKKLEESPIPSTSDYLQKSTTPTKEMTVQDAIELLNKSGAYVVKKIVKSYKAVYKNSDGEEGITSSYFRTKEEFESANPGKQFITFIKELNKADEEKI
jgi:hypothetical protein